MRLIVASLVLFISGHVKAVENCDNKGTLFYEELGCKPVHEEGKECPVRYECADFKTKNRCIFQGRSLSIGDQLDNNLTYPSCNVGCFCEQSGKFTCAQLDCPEWLGSPIEPNCYREYKLGSCCSVGQICPSKNAEMSKCQVDGRTYLEGEKFQPENTCMSCVCPKNFNGKFEAPHCKRTSCGIQIRHSQELENKCAPVYSNRTVLCCPKSWLCPNQPVEISKDNARLTSDLTCQFGEHSIKLDGKLSSKVEIYGETKSVSCTCSMPPLVTCIEQ